MTLDELTNALPIGNAKAPFVYRLMRILMRSGFFIEAKISQHDDEEGLNSLVDVGGGTGTLAKEIADAFLDLNCIVTDLPHVVDGLVANNKSLAFVGGDMFVAIPPADDVIMKGNNEMRRQASCID
ncbi:myricetin O-methyltransferase-like [Coffea eugenioides]|uniref:myricetin O-methyltransferase-like n=1 Tax=Coffea eugenioides TaxID=49369 RepID=UPI000F613A7E|nr:myricetin O-methyltransferase-like [Coffea eugenioides]XP_027166622.1 myricetin O-methyltransferase-like [Coffea eugenioides]